jgi:hypothetical protein
VAGKLPKNDTKLRERVEAAYWAALDQARRTADRLACLISHYAGPNLSLRVVYIG